MSGELTTSDCVRATTACQWQLRNVFKHTSHSTFTFAFEPNVTFRACAKVRTSKNVTDCIVLARVVITRTPGLCNKKRRCNLSNKLTI